MINLYVKKNFRFWDPPLNAPMTPTKTIEF